MKRITIALLTLLICVGALTSCSDFFISLNEDSSIRELDALQQEYESKGYRVTRASQEEVTSFNESIVAQEGLILKGALTGKMEYEYTNPETGEFTWGITIGTSHDDDAKAIADMYRDMGEALNNVKVNVSNRGLIVYVTYTYEN